jgi:hypothetical protein
MKSWRRLEIDFSYTRQECAETLWSIFQKKSDNLHNILNLDSFHYYEIFLKDMGQDIDDEFINKIIKKYIDKFFERKKLISSDGVPIQNLIKKSYPDLLKYWDLEKEKKLIHKIDRPTIEEMLIKVINDWEIVDNNSTLNRVTKGFGYKEEHLLNNISVEEYKTHIISSVSFAENIMYFLSSYIHNMKYFIDYFANAIKNIKLALKDLREVSDNYKYKVDYIIKKTNIKLDD